MASPLVPPCCGREGWLGAISELNQWINLAMRGGTMAAVRTVQQADAHWYRWLVRSAMAQDLDLDYLIVIAHHEPPAAAAVSRALATAGLGVFDYTPAPPPDDPTAPAPGGRRRLGTYAATTPVTQATARILAYRYDEPVTAGMGAPMFAEMAHGLVPGDLRALKEGSVALDLRVSIPSERALAGLGWTLRVLTVLLEQSEGTCIDLAAQRALGRGRSAAAECRRSAGACPLPRRGVGSGDALAAHAWIAEAGPTRAGIDRGANVAAG